MPSSEILLWKHLSGKRLLDCKFRRQYGVGSYVIDFYCPALKLAIELDGESHFRPGASDHDAERQNYIESFGIEFLRFTNEEIFENLDDIIERITEKVLQRRLECSRRA
jgi:very-short-patch-repair endonuclease